MLSLGHWNRKNQQNTRVILLFSIVWCLVISNTKVFTGFTAIRLQQKRFIAVMVWTFSWLGRLVSIMAPLSYCQILSSMLGFCFCSQHLLRLTLDPSPLIEHQFWRWKHTMILGMVIISVISIIAKIYIIGILGIIQIIAFQVGWNLSVLGSYTS